MAQQVVRGERPEGGIIFDGIVAGLSYPTVGVQLIDDDEDMVIIGRTGDHLIERDGGVRIWYPLIPDDLPFGTYRAQLDNDGGAAAEGHVANVAINVVGALTSVAAPTDYTPAVADVGAILRARTLDTAGNELGTFTADTRPTQEQVIALIQQAQDDVTAVTDDDIPAGAWRYASTAIALRTALLIELSYFPEQVNSGRSPYQQLLELYEGPQGDSGALARLNMAVERERSEEVLDDEISTPLQPVWYDGNPYIADIGLGTIW